MKNADYRFTQYERRSLNKSQQKEDLKNMILSNHPQVINFYSWISDKDGGYKDKMIKIYDDKCVYCGNSLDNITIDLFEIDHYVNKTSFSNKQQANEIENIFPSCHSCNRGKDSIFIDPENNYYSILHPDNGIENVFYRDDDYSIKVKDEHKEDSFIELFYKALGLSYETKRLDYLLLSMRGMAIKYKQEPIGGILQECISILQVKRNRYTH